MYHWIFYSAGVLRGEKGRFQLFGDTMNTASRIESTGQRNKIHISQETAYLLTAAGKEGWLTAREDRVFAKGKGQLQTYWMQITDESDIDTGSASASLLDSDGKKDMPYKQSLKLQLQALRVGDEEDQVAKTHGEVVLSDKAERLVRWNVDILTKLLRQVMARRASTSGFKRTNRNGTLARSRGHDGCLGGVIIDEVTDVLSLPHFDAHVFENQVDPASIDIPPKVHSQLTDYVSKIAAMYRNNPFHNFVSNTCDSGWHVSPLLLQLTHCLLLSRNMPLM